MSRTMRQIHSERLTLAQASMRGMTLSEWARHEQALDAVQEIEQGRQERVIYVLLSLCVSCGVIALLCLGV